MTLPMGSDNGHADGQEDLTRVMVKIKQRQHLQKVRTARALVGRMQTLPDGKRVFIRFDRTQRLEHQLLMLTFGVLAFTGLIQRFSRFTAVAFIINWVMGGIETVRTIHHLGAFLFIAQALYHTWTILHTWFVKRERGGMWPRRKDLADLVGMVKYNLGKAVSRPSFDRYSVEEKVEYWALLWGGTIMIITGIFQWFPLVVTRIFPGSAIPVSRAIHGWEAVLATLSILTWHLYHTVIKEKNRSIFTGFIAEKEMQENHPLEYKRILAAEAFLNKLAQEKASQLKFQKPEGDQVQSIVLSDNVEQP